MASSSLILTTTLLLAVTTLSLISLSHSATCDLQTFTQNHHYNFCTDLPTLNSYLHWTFDSTNSTLSIAFIAPPSTPNGWISWAINPNVSGTVGSQALIAFREANGEMTVKTYDITSYGPVKESRVWYEVRNSIFATLVLPEKGKTTVNQLWQVGGSVTGGVPDTHGSLDLLIGESKGVTGDDNDRINKKNVRFWYLKTVKSADPAWFLIHAFFQVAAYVIGVAGWGTGLKLGSESDVVMHAGHGRIGISIFVLATVQICAVFLRPDKDHKYRIYWNIYHYSVGYAILILGIFNVLGGFRMLKPDPKYIIINAYFAVIFVLVGISILLEIITWIIVIKNKKCSRSPISTMV
ncbi:hypothetical protein ACJIZ3_017745 [Penstemon smallii]|uniref:Cytochrome b561 and DOMON domain-containing protein n=1 Tax=Penstemon smallii TaxID=265156 RepID=A0ABD3SXK8_9LAMI